MRRLLCSLFGWHIWKCVGSYNYFVNKGDGVHATAMFTRVCQCCGVVETEEVVGCTLTDHNQLSMPAANLIPDNRVHLPKPKADMGNDKEYVPDIVYSCKVKPC